MFHRYAFVRQHDQSDCGAAALATVARHYRIPVGLEQMRTLAGTDRVGTNLLGLVQAAEKIGFSARAVKGPYEALPSVPLPAIVHIHTAEGLGHFIVLHAVADDSVVVADPAHGVYKLSKDEFCERWTGYLLMMAPDAQRQAQSLGKAQVSAWRRYLALLRPHGTLVLEAFACAVLMTLLGLSTSFFIQHLVDNVLLRNETKLLNALGVGMVLVLVFKVLFGALREYLLAHISRKVDLGLIAGYARHILGLPLNFFEMRRVGDILSRVNDAGKLREAISGTTTTVLVDGVLVIAIVAVLLLYDLPLALVAIGFIPLLGLSVYLHHPAAKRRCREAMENAGQLSAHLAEDVSGVETIKAFGRERTRAEEGEARLVNVVQSVFSLQKIGASINALGTLVTAAAGITILWYGGHRVMSGALSIGELMFFHSLLGCLLEPLARMASVNVQIQDGLAAVDRLYQVLDLELEPMGSGDRVEFQSVSDAIELKDASFKYGCRANVLEGVNLRIPAGQTVAIVGESGSGKSTLLKLLMGYYFPQEGQILIDGMDMRDYDLAALRGRIGLVSQDAFVFTGTIRENIALGRPEASLEEVIEAAEAAGLGEFIGGLPERYDTVIGERGANMSGGQRQRLAIARALLRKPEVLIFDEATSHLDTTTEQAIQKNLKTALAGKTVVLVAHRLSTIKDADLIYVLHQGQVAEQGTHRELLALGGRYAALCRAQSGDDAGVNRATPPERKISSAIEQLTHRGEKDAPRSQGLPPTETTPVVPARASQSIFDIQLDAPIPAPTRKAQSIFDLQLN